MTKKWYLVLVAVGAFLTALFTCEPFFTEYPLTAEGSYITGGILCVLAFLFLVFAVVFAFLKEKLLLLPFSTLLSCIVPVVIFTVAEVPWMSSILLALLFTVLSVCVCFLAKAEHKTKNRLAVLVIAVFSIATYIGYIYGTPLLDALGLINSVPPMGAAVAVMAIGLLFTLLKEKSSKLAFSIYIGIMALFFFASFILQIIAIGFYIYTIFLRLFLFSLRRATISPAMSPRAESFWRNLTGWKRTALKRLPPQQKRRRGSTLSTHWKNCRSCARRASSRKRSSPRRKIKF